MKEKEIIDVKEEKKDKMNMRIFRTFIIVICLVGLGAGGMYYILQQIPGTTIVNKLEKEVTVNESGIADAVEKVYDSVVVVETYQNNQLSGSGTGFIFKKDGNTYYVLTNNHVVSDATSVKLVFNDGSTEETTLVGSDPYIDTAVLSFESKNDYSIAEIGSSEDARIGDTVFTVGSPINRETYSGTVTRGILSGKDRLVSVSLNGNSSTADYLMRSLQTDAAINAGNSGGPLCNSNGQVIGITNMKLASSVIEGMSFAIPIEDAINYANKLLNGEDVSRPFFGVSTFDLTTENVQALYYSYGIKVPNNVTSGVIIGAVQSDSAADKAGLKKGDVITKINGEEISSSAEFRYKLYQYNVGDKVKVTYNRNGSEKETTVTLSKMSE